MFTPFSPDGYHKSAESETSFYFLLTEHFVQIFLKIGAILINLFLRANKGKKVKYEVDPSAYFREK